MTIRNIEKPILERKELPHMAVDFNAEVMAIQNTIKTELITQEANELTAGAFNVSLSAIGWTARP